MRPSELARLDFLVGEWSSFDRMYPGPAGAGGTSQGTASYRWDVGGGWLLYDFRSTLPGLGPYAVHGGVAHDAAGGTYQAFAVNNLGNVLLYEGAWADDKALVFTLTYPERQAATRVSYLKGPDGTVTMTSERPDADGGPERYFETVLSRRNPIDP